MGGGLYRPLGPPPLREPLDLREQALSNRRKQIAAARDLHDTNIARGLAAGVQRQDPANIGKDAKPALDPDLAQAVVDERARNNEGKGFTSWPVVSAIVRGAEELDKWVVRPILDSPFAAAHLPVLDAVQNIGEKTKLSDVGDAILRKSFDGNPRYRLPDYQEHPPKGSREEGDPIFKHTRAYWNGIVKNSKEITQVGDDEYGGPAIELLEITREAYDELDTPHGYLGGMEVVNPLGLPFRVIKWIGKPVALAAELAAKEHTQALAEGLVDGAQGVFNRRKGTVTVDESGVKQDVRVWEETPALEFGIKPDANILDEVRDIELELNMGGVSYEQLYSVSGNFAMFGALLPKWINPARLFYPAKTFDNLGEKLTLIRERDLLRVKNQSALVDIEMDAASVVDPNDITKYVLNKNGERIKKLVRGAPDDPTFADTAARRKPEDFVFAIDESGLVAETHLKPGALVELAKKSEGESSNAFMRHEVWLFEHYIPDEFVELLGRPLTEMEKMVRDALDNTQKVAFNRIIAQQDAERIKLGQIGVPEEILLEEPRELYRMRSVFEADGLSDNHELRSARLQRAILGRRMKSFGDSYQQPRHVRTREQLEHEFRYGDTIWNSPFDTAKRRYKDVGDTEAWSKYLVALERFASKNIKADIAKQQTNLDIIKDAENLAKSLTSSRATRTNRRRGVEKGDVLDYAPRFKNAIDSGDPNAIEVEIQSVVDEIKDLDKRAKEAGIEGELSVQQMFFGITSRLNKILNIDYETNKADLLVEALPDMLLDPETIGTLGKTFDTQRLSTTDLIASFGDQRMNTLLREAREIGAYHSRRHVLEERIRHIRLDLALDTAIRLKSPPPNDLSRFAPEPIVQAGTQRYVEVPGIKHGEPPLWKRTNPTREQSRSARKARQLIAAEDELEELSRKFGEDVDQGFYGRKVLQDDGSIHHRQYYTTSRSEARGKAIRSEFIERYVRGSRIGREAEDIFDAIEFIGNRNSKRALDAKKKLMKQRGVSEARREMFDNVMYHERKVNALLTQVKTERTLRAARATREAKTDGEPTKSSDISSGLPPRLQSETDFIHRMKLEYEKQQGTHQGSAGPRSETLDGEPAKRDKLERLEAELLHHQQELAGESSKLRASVQPDLESIRPGWNLPIQNRAYGNIIDQLDYNFIRQFDDDLFVPPTQILNKWGSTLATIARRFEQSDAVKFQTGRKPIPTYQEASAGARKVLGYDKLDPDKKAALMKGKPRKPSPMPTPPRSTQFKVMFAERARVALDSRTNRPISSKARALGQAWLKTEKIAKHLKDWKDNAKSSIADSEKLRSEAKKGIIYDKELGALQRLAPNRLPDKAKDATEGLLFPQKWVDGIHRQTSMPDHTITAVLQFAGTISAFLKTTKSVLDVGSPLVHGQGAFAGRINLALRAMKLAYKATINPHVQAEWEESRRASSRESASYGVAYSTARQQASPIFDPENPELLGGSRTPLDAAAQSMLARSQRTPKKAVSNIDEDGNDITEYVDTFGSKAWRKAAQKTRGFERGLMRWVSMAERHFNHFGNVLREAYWDGMKDAWVDEGGSLEGLAQYINNLTGTFQPEWAGLSKAQIAAERSLLGFAPRLNRAEMAMVANATKHGKLGDHARKSVMQRLIILPMYYMSLAYMFGQEPKLDPRPKSEGGDGAEFMTLEFHGTNVGLSGPFLSLVRLAADVASTPEEDFFQTINPLAGRDNPFVNFMHSRQAPAAGVFWDLIRGETYMGEPLESPADWAQWGAGQVTPFWVESAFLSHGGSGTGINGGSIFAGLSEFFGARTFPVSTYEKLEDARNQAAGIRYGESDFNNLNRLQRQTIDNDPATGVDILKEELGDRYSEDRELTLTSLYMELLNNYRETRAVNLNLGQDDVGPDGRDTRWFREHVEHVNDIAYGQSELLRSDFFATTHEQLRESIEMNTRILPAEDIAYEEYMTKIFLNTQLTNDDGSYDFDARRLLEDEFIERWGPETFEYVQQILEMRIATPDNGYPDLLKEMVRGRRMFSFYWDDTREVVLQASRDPEGLRQRMNDYYSATRTDRKIILEEDRELSDAINQIDRIQVKLREKDPILDIFTYRFYTDSLRHPDNQWEGADEYYRTQKYLEFPYPRFVQEPSP